MSSDLSINQLAEHNRRRAVEWRKGVPAEDVPVLFAVVELVGECGEFANAMKHLERERLGIVGGTTSELAAKKELADVVICASLMANRMGWDLSDLVVSKFNATSAKHGFATMIDPGWTPGVLIDLKDLKTAIDLIESGDQTPPMTTEEQETLDRLRAAANGGRG